MYRIVRFYCDAKIRRRIINSGLTLEQVQSHCKDPDTSSRTCTSNVGRARTRKLGHWFDGYEKAK